MGGSLQIEVQMQVERFPEEGPVEKRGFLERDQEKKGKREKGWGGNPRKSACPVPFLTLIRGHRLRM